MPETPTRVASSLKAPAVQKAIRKAPAVIPTTDSDPSDAENESDEEISENEDVDCNTDLQILDAAAIKNIMVSEVFNMLFMLVIT